MANVFDANMLKKTFLAGTKRLDSKQEWINELNVFPVPDGDTGTNMTLTLMNAVGELEKLQENAGMDEVSKTIASGTLRGARGNSGVIMSQLVRGFSKEIEGHKEIDKALVENAFDRAVKTAYKAVMKPKEGTILTVARATAEKAAELSKTDLSLEAFFTEILKYAEDVLEQTPDMLPVLKEAGVVDSGGQGLVEFLAGALDAQFTLAPLRLACNMGTFPEVIKEGLMMQGYPVGKCLDPIQELTPDEKEKLRKVLVDMGLL